MLVRSSVGNNPREIKATGNSDALRRSDLLSANFDRSEPKVGFWEALYRSTRLGKLRIGPGMTADNGGHQAVDATSHFDGLPTMRSNEIAGLLHQAHGRILDPCLSVIRSGRGG